MRCVWPLPPDKSVNRVDAGYLDPEYPKWRKRAGLSPDEHPGIDINLSGTAGNADEGYPVVAVLPGVVVHAQRHKVWGNIVLIRHHDHVARALGYEALWTQYAHLQHICVREGFHIAEGEPVGSLGRGDPLRPFLAHLHFEVRVADLPADYWPRTRDNILKGYLDPLLFLQRHASYERRYPMEQAILYEGLDKVVKGRSIVNLDTPGTLHLRIIK